VAPSLPNPIRISVAIASMASANRKALADVAGSLALIDLNHSERKR
jgi:hypothetical protein